MMAHITVQDVWKSKKIHLRNSILEDSKLCLCISTFLFICTFYAKGTDINSSTIKGNNNNNNNHKCGDETAIQWESNN
jgi:hypothetical protein